MGSLGSEFATCANSKIYFDNLFNGFWLGALEYVGDL